MFLKSGFLLFFMSEPNSHIRIISIDELQPTDHFLYAEILNEIYKGTYHPSGLPEIWQSFEDSELYFIADGHHRIYNAFEQEKQEMVVNFHCKENTLLTRIGYFYALEEVRKKADACREAGFFHISHLLVQ
jgi:uncharacterized protein (DUF1015 family)